MYVYKTIYIFFLLFSFAFISVLLIVPSLFLSLIFHLYW